MIYKRKYLQFNNLVFDGFDLISDADGGASFKANTQEYTARNGSYVAFKQSYMLVGETTVSMTAKFSTKKIPCDMREYYNGFVIQELTKPGKLWAIQNNTLVWAYGFIANLNPVGGTERDVMEYDIDITLYEGVWHKADKHKTFLQPYDVCSFLLCEGWQVQKPCATGSCCVDCYAIHDVRECCCECDDVTKDMSLCHMKNSLQDFYKKCRGGYRIVYNCQKGQEFFGDVYLGEKICTEDMCDTIIAGQFFSDTDIPSDGVTIHITGGRSGTIKDPAVTINGNTNVIKGEYEGSLHINPNGEVINSTDCCDTVLDPSALSIPSGNDYGWEVHKGNNSLIINSCCGLVCAYIETDDLTI